jgi:hypothetical protein
MWGYPEAAVLRRTLFACIVLMALSAGRAEALNARDVIALTKAGLGEPVLLALIEVDRSIFAIDAATIKELKEAGVTDGVILAMIRSGRQTPPPPEPAPDFQPPPPEPPPPSEPPPSPEPSVDVIEHHDAPAPEPVFYPVAVPVYVPYPIAVSDGRRAQDSTVKATIATDKGLVKARVPVPLNCVKAEPVYWGWGGKLRPGSWEPPPTVVCR